MAFVRTGLIIFGLLLGWAVARGEASVVLGLLDGQAPVPVAAL